MSCHALFLLRLQIFSILKQNALANFVFIMNQFVSWNIEGFKILEGHEHFGRGGEKITTFWFQYFSATHMVENDIRCVEKKS